MLPPNEPPNHAGARKYPRCEDPDIGTIKPCGAKSAKRKNIKPINCSCAQKQFEDLKEPSPSRADASADEKNEDKRPRKS
jgi:hypothetical protein